MPSISRVPSDDEFSEHSSIQDEMFGGSNIYHSPSINSSSSEDVSTFRFPGLSSYGDHPSSMNVPDRLSDISRLTDADGGIEEV
jgi:hypothetical protein